MNPSISLSLFVILSKQQVVQDLDERTLKATIHGYLDQIYPHVLLLRRRGRYDEARRRKIELRSRDIELHGSIETYVLPRFEQHQL